MNTRASWGVRVFDALASIQLAVVVMVALAAACAAATFYEAAHGTGAAQRVFYRSPWFTALLVLLAANVLFSMLKKYPWNRHHTGFVLAHLGILFILQGSLASLHLGVDGTLAVREGGRAGHYTVDGRALAVTVASTGAQGEVPVDLESDEPGQGRERRFDAGSGLVAVAQEYARHAEVSTALEESEEGPPALHFRMSGGFGEEHGWLVADEGGFEFGPLLVTFRRAASAQEADGMASALSRDASRGLFVQTPDGSVRYVFTSRKATPFSGVVELGRPLETPWMGMTLTIQQAVPHVAWRRQVRPSAPPAGEGALQPAVKVRVEGPWGTTRAEWIAWGEGQALPFPGGEALVFFRPRQAALPFRVELIDFESKKYPGTAMAATYESRVRVDDPERGTSEHLIAMNQPLHYGGYTFFQSSYLEGTPMTSVLAVSRSPGLPLVYLGTALLCLGAGWMFYLKPLLARRQGARVLAERRRRDGLAAAGARA